MKMARTIYGMCKHWNKKNRGSIGIRNTCKRKHSKLYSLFPNAFYFLLLLKQIPSIPLFIHWSYLRILCILFSNSLCNQLFSLYVNAVPKNMHEIQLVLSLCNGCVLYETKYSWNSLTKLSYIPIFEKSISLKSNLMLKTSAGAGDTTHYTCKGLHERGQRYMENSTKLFF